MKKFSTRTIVIYALLTAMTMVATYAVKIPTVATEGYVNPGDAVLLFAGVAFGPFAGFLAGGVGSCLADLAAGYSHWIFPTFVIKGAEGFLAGLLFLAFRRMKLNKHMNAALSIVPPAFLMVLGYFIASTIMKGSAATALLSVPANCLQATFGVVLSFVLLFGLGKIKGFSSLVGKNYYFDYPGKGKKSASLLTETTENTRKDSDKKKESTDLAEKN
ncbi:MAG: ECF transporter S component [Clostridia bacterium]|nr:ECF transporter S component [Clostridia bacterium]